MLDGLDQVEWSNISHAFGPATNVPWLLRAVAGSDQAARDAAIPELWGTIWHQGTVYEASAYAVPFLARIARQAAMPDSDRAMLVALLGAIAAGWSYLEVHAGYLRTTSAAVDELALAREMDGVAAARAAVGREAPALFADLGGAEDRPTGACRLWPRRWPSPPCRRHGWSSG